MNKHLIYFIMILYLSLYNLGCSLLHSDSLSREDGYYVKHLQSCGPRAAQAALEELKKGNAPDEKYVTVLEVAKEMQDNGGNALRLSLSLFNHQAMQITFPHEIERFFEKRGYEVSRVKSFDNLKPELDVALVLVRDSFFSKYWHWLCFPVNYNIEDYFGKDTKIHIILLIQKR